MNNDQGKGCHSPKAKESGFLINFRAQLKKSGMDKVKHFFELKEL